LNIREQNAPEQRGIKRPANNGRYTIAPPPLDGTSKGGVKFFRGGNKNFGNKGREMVMPAVSDERITNPNSLFQNGCVTGSRKLPPLKWNHLRS
jgi:hypothetical protein